MNDKLMKFLDGVFLPYEDLQPVKELKEELSNDLQEKLSDLKNQGYYEVTAYSVTIDSIGDVSELIGSIAAKTKQLQQMVNKDFSNINLQNSDFKNNKYTSIENSSVEVENIEKNWIYLDYPNFKSIINLKHIS